MSRRTFPSSHWTSVLPFKVREASLFCSFKYFVAWFTFGSRVCVSMLLGSHGNGWKMYFWLGVLPCMREQGRELIFSLKRARLAQARIAEARPDFYARTFAQARSCFLSDELSRSGEIVSPKWESAKLPRVTVAVSPKRSLQFEREHSSRLSEDSQLEWDLAWVLAMLRFMNIVGCLIGWFIDLLYKGVDIHVLCMLWVGTNELVMSLAWYMIGGWSCILNDMLMVCIRTSWLIMYE